MNGEQHAVRRRPNPVTVGLRELVPVEDSEPQVNILKAERNRFV